MAENVQHIRLINGQELIGDIIGNDDDAICIDTPMLIEERFSDKGSSIVLMEYSPFSMTSVCQIKKSHIVTSNQIHPTMKKYYYLSRKVCKRSTDSILADIQEVNETMESILMESTIDAPRLCKGTSTVQ